MVMKSEVYYVQEYVQSSLVYQVVATNAYGADWSYMITREAIHEPETGPALIAYAAATAQRVLESDNLVWEVRLWRMWGWYEGRQLRPGGLIGRIRWGLEA